MVPFLFGLILEKAFLFLSHGMQKMNERVTSGAAPFAVGLVLRAAAFAPSCWTLKGLNQFSFLFGSLHSLPYFSLLSVCFQLQLFYLEMSTNLLFHTLLLIVTVLFMHMVMFQAFVLLRSLDIVVFFLL